VQHEVGHAVNFAIQGRPNFENDLQAIFHAQKGKMDLLGYARTTRTESFAEAFNS